VFPLAFSQSLSKELVVVLALDPLSSAQTGITVKTYPMLGLLSKKPKDDIAHRVVERLGELGLPGLPRNYETIYALETSATPELERAFLDATKDGKPTQFDIDQIHRKFVGNGDIPTTFHDRLLSEIKDVVTMLDEDRKTRIQYREVLVTAANGIESGVSEAVFKRLIGIIQDANDAEIARGSTTVANIECKSKDLEIVQRELEMFKSMALEDPLTGISNRRVFDMTLRNIYAQQAEKARTALIVADIDHFKQFNDRYGHIVGDQVLKEVANVLQSNVSHDSIVCRTGGEEFAVVLRDVSSTQAIVVAERLRMAIGKCRIIGKGNGADFGSVSMSFGVCMANVCSCSEELYAKADEALYTSKRDGRNRCTLHVVTPQSCQRRAS